MKTFLSALLGLALSAVGLQAQEVLIGEPSWLMPGYAPAHAPRFGPRLSVAYPDEMLSTSESGYVILLRYFRSDGEPIWRVLDGSHLPFAHAVERALANWKPAPQWPEKVRPTDTIVCQPVIFNPRAANSALPDAAPRLLAVTPIEIDAKILGSVNQPRVIRGAVSLDAEGNATSVRMIGTVYARFQPFVAAALKDRRFAPARRGGLPRPAEMEVPFVLTPPWDVARDRLTPPRASKRFRPLFPADMPAEEIRGRALLSVSIDREGNVTRASLISSDNPALNEPALDVIWFWKFEPATRLGQPIPFQFTQPIDLGPGQGPATLTLTPPPRSGLPPAKRASYDIAPKATNVTLPVYPYAMLKEGAAGRARISFVVSPVGGVVEARVDSATRPEFGLAARAAIEKYRFEPALLAGKPVRAPLVIEEIFDPKDAGDFPGEAELAMLELERSQPAQIQSPETLDQPLAAISQSTPYPPVLALNGPRSASALLEFIVDEKGRVRLPRLVSSTDEGYGYTALQATSNWLFAPPRRLGQPAIVRVRKEVSFSFPTKP